MNMLITEEYRQLNKSLHAKSELYGVSGQEWRAYVRPLAAWGRKRILDYGAGKCTLSQALGPAYRVTNYDPCVDGIDSPPDPHPVVFCGDVLEHIEPECLDEVLRDILRVTKEVAFIVVAVNESSQMLDDGRNAHLTVQGPDWWRTKIEGAGFEIVQMKPLDRTIVSTWFVVKPRSVQ